MLRNTSARNTIRNMTLLIGSTMTVMAPTAISPSLPQMRMAFQDNPNVDLLVRLALTMPALFVALTAPLVGGLLDRWGRRPVLIVSVVLYAFAGSSGYLLDSLYAILGSRAVLGIAVAGIMSGFTTLIGDYFKGTQLNLFMGLQASFMGFGGVVFLIGGGFLADVSWRFPFLIYGSALLILPGVIVALPESVHGTMPKINLAENSQIILPKTTIGIIYLLGFLGMVIFYMIPVQLPFYLKSLAEVNSEQIGYALATMTLFAAFMSLQFQRIRRSYSSNSIFAFLFVTMGFGYSIVSRATHYNHVIFAMIIIGVGAGLLLPNLNVWIVSIVPTTMRGRIVGWYTMYFFLGQFVSPILIQPIAQRTSIAESFGIAGGLSFLIGIIFWIAVRLQRWSRSVNA